MRNKKQKRRPSGCMLLLAIMLFLVAAVSGGLYAVFSYYMGKTNYVEIDPEASIEITGEYIEETVDGTNSPQDMIDQIEQNLSEHISGIEENGSFSEGGNNTANSTQEVVSDVAGVEHVLLIGSDRRSQNWNGNSDSMILITINHNTKKIILTSIMRDSYVYIAGVGNAKINAAYAKGGPALLLDTVRKNLKIHVTQYATVDFSAFTSVINVLGTIPMTLNNDEIAYLGSQLDGLQHNGNLYYLDGDTALAYARIRYVGRWDFERTERQRRVLTEVFNKMKHMDLGQLNAMANAVLPYVTHNITNGQILSWIAQSPQLLNYQLVSNRIPYDGMYQNAIINNMDVLALDWNQNVAQLKKVLFE